MLQQLEKYVQDFIALGLSNVTDFEKFNRIAIVHHSSAIEGSTLTFEETSLLINEGITSKGKPLSEHEMINDHYKALMFCIDAAEKKTPVTIDFLKQINALVNKNTGQVRNTALGICDDTKGDFRLGNITAGTTYFVNYDKVSLLTEKLCSQLQSVLVNAKTNEEIYKLSFDAHYNLVTIHPWFDGNGRTSRLLMNYIHLFHGKPLSIVFVEDKPAYIKALNDARQENDIHISQNFMCSQLIKYISTETEKYNKRNSGFTFFL